MSALHFNPLSCSSRSSKSVITAKFDPPLMMKSKRTSSRVVPVKACIFNPNVQEPILKEALKEPIAFMGGMFAGLLRLDLNDEPLKEWLQRTVEASRITEEEINADSREPEDEVPQQIEIE